MYTPTCRPGRGRLNHPRSRLAEIAKYAAALAIATVMILAPGVAVPGDEAVTARPDGSRPVLSSGLPGIVTADVSGLEDSVLPLHITVGPTPPGQELLIDVSGVPSGATLSAGLDKGDSTWRLAPHELEGLSLTLPADFNGQISLSVSLSVVIRKSIDVTVSPIADAPRLTVSDASGVEDTEIPINIQVEANPNEELSIAVARLPAGAALSGGTGNDDGSWALGLGDLAGLSLKLPENFSGNAEFVVSATAVDGDDVAVTTQAATLNIMPAADNAQLIARNVVGSEDQAVPLDIAVELFDPKEQLELFLSGILDQARLSVGQEVSAGTWAVEPEDLPGLMFTPPANFNGVQPIIVTAVTADGNSRATVAKRFIVEVAAVADEPVLVVADAVGLEDETIPLNVTVRAGAPDEVVSVMISDVPEAIALSAGQNSGGGEWELEQEELEGLHLLPPKDFNGVLDLVAVARAVDGDDVATAQATFSVLIAPIAEQPVLDVNNVAGDEDTAIPLGVDVSPPADGEGIDITLGPLPDGATLSAGLDSGDGTWVLVPEELAGLSLMPPPNYNGSIEVIAKARATDQGHSKVVEKGFVVNVASILDAPLLVVHDVSGKEDQAVPLGLSVEPTGTDETMDIVVSGVPAGASLTKGTNVGAAEWLLQRDDLAGLELLPAENYHGNFILAVVVIASDAGEEAVSTGDFRVSLAPVADKPLLKIADVFGFEDEPVPLELSVGQTDPSEALTIQVSGVPDGAAFSSGTDAGGGRWTLGADELPDLKLFLPANDNGTFTLTVSAMTKSGDDEASTSGEIEVAVAPIADPPFLAVSDASMLEDEPALLGIVAESTGKTDSLTVTLEGVPEGASLSAGTRIGNRWELAPEDLAGLELTPPANLNGVLNLTVTATANDGDDTTTVQEAFDVEIAPIADPPRLLVHDIVTDEEIPVLLNIDLAATGGGETVLAAVSGLPQGATLSAGTPTGDGTWELAIEQLQELILTPPADFNGVFGLTVTASAVESDASDTAVVGEFVTVTVKPVADAPILTVENTTSTGGAIPLRVEIAPSGPTEQISVTVAGVAEGMALSAGRNNGDGSWSLEPRQLAGLTLDVRADFEGTIELTVSAMSTEPVGNDVAISEATLEIQVGSEPLETRLETEVVGTGPVEPVLTWRGLRVREEAEALEPRTTASTSIASVEHVEMTYVARVGANIRAQPTTESARVGGLPQGGRVQVTGRASGGNWLRIATNDGGAGFVFGELLEPVGTRPAVDTPPAAPATPQTQTQTAAATPQLRIPLETEFGTDAPPAAPVTPVSQTQVATVTPHAAAPGSSEVRSAFRDCDTCPEMVVLRGGSFVMGDDQGDKTQRPAREVRIGREFAIGRYEVTVREWLACVNTGGCSDLPSLGDFAPESPVRNVSWDDTRQYVSWLSQVTGRAYRLPSEAEWEYAARGGTQTTYSWGDDLRVGQVACSNCGGEWSRQTPGAVGTFEPNPVGLFDMHGSVAEWTHDCWQSTLGVAPADGSAFDQRECRQRVLRGGSWRSRNPAFLTSAARFFYDAPVRYVANGFRVVAQAGLLNRDTPELRFKKIMQYLNGEIDLEPNKN